MGPFLRVCVDCGQTMERVKPAAPPADLQDWSWGCTPTGAFRCTICGRTRKFRLEDREPRDRELLA